MMTAKNLEAAAEIVWGPQPGPQTMFMSTTADVVVYGGGAGGGKTWVELFEPLRHIIPTDQYPEGVPGFTAVIFRRVSPQIRNEGGLWDESKMIYPSFDGDPRESILEWRFNKGEQTVRFASMQHEEDKNDWQGSQIPLIMFDELTHFTEEQFFYMLSRNRSMCGVRPYMRATCNPDADSWVADLIAWWIDQEEFDSEGNPNPRYGLPLQDRAGVVRFFVRVGNEMIWADTPEPLVPHVEAYAKLAGIPAISLVKSFTFIPSSVYDNKKLLERNPQYLGNLLAMHPLERARLLDMNWKVRAASGKVFNRAWFTTEKYLDAVPVCTHYVRFWDKAATEGAGAATAGVLLGLFDKGVVIIDVVRGQWSSGRRDTVMLATAEEDRENYGNLIDIWVEQEPGSGGKDSLEATLRLLAGFKVHGERVTGDKVARALPVASQAEHGNVYIVRAPWNKSLIDEAHNFPDQKLKDQVDAISGAYNKIKKRRVIDRKKWHSIYA